MASSETRHFPTYLGVAAVLLLAVGFYVFVLRDMYHVPSEHERSVVGAKWKEDGFAVGIVWPAHADKSLVEGVTFAAADVNAGRSALAGKIRLRIYDSEVNDHGALARRVAANRDVVAVIGHELAENTVPASVTYQRHGILYISPKETDRVLTSHEFSSVFRLTPTDTAITDALVQFALERNWTKIGGLYARMPHGEAASSQFLTAARREQRPPPFLSLDVPFFQSFLEEPDAWAQDFRAMAATLRQTPFDAVFVAVRLPWAGKLLVDMTRMGITAPVLATDKLDSFDLLPADRPDRAAAVSAAANNRLFVASAVDPSTDTPEYLDFRQRFRAKYGVDPGYGASQGYEAFLLLVNAVLLSQSADPVVVASTLKTRDFGGLFGRVHFSNNGDIDSRPVSIKQFRDGAFHTVWKAALGKESQ